MLCSCVLQWGLTSSRWVLGRPYISGDPLQSHLDSNSLLDLITFSFHACACCTNTCTSIESEVIGLNHCAENPVVSKGFSRAGMHIANDCCDRWAELQRACRCHASGGHSFAQLCGFKLAPCHLENIEGHICNHNLLHSAALLLHLRQRQFAVFCRASWQCTLPVFRSVWLATENSQSGNVQNPGGTQCACLAVTQEGALQVAQIVLATRHIQ